MSHTRSEFFIQERHGVSLPSAPLAAGTQVLNQPIHCQRQLFGSVIHTLRNLRADFGQTFCPGGRSDFLALQQTSCGGDDDLVLGACKASTPAGAPVTPVNCTERTAPAPPTCPAPVTSMAASHFPGSVPWTRSVVAATASESVGS